MLISLEERIKIKLNKHDVLRILKISSLIIIPFIILYISIFSYFTKIQIDTTIQLIIGEQRQRANTIDSIVKDIYNESVEDLNLIKNANELSDYINFESPSNFNEVQQMFYRVALTKSHLDQVRLLDLNGKEIIRVNNIDGTPIIVKEENLQNKQDSSYFNEVLKLSKGEIYISDLDLNVENKVVEKPNKPIVRVATPLYSDNNELKSILIINYLGSDIFYILEEQLKDIEYEFIVPFLINSDGYYLYNQDTSKTFSFMFENEEQYNFATEQPSVFDELLQNESGYIEVDDEIFYYRKIVPTENIENYYAEDCCWYFVSKFNKNTLPIMANIFIFNLSLTDFIILVTLCLLILYIIIMGSSKLFVG